MMNKINMVNSNRALYKWRKILVHSLTHSGKIVLKDLVSEYLES